jgi:hypothetical protein
MKKNARRLEVLRRMHISFAHTINNYMVLRPDWLGVPTYDFPAGIDVDGSPLYICRAFLSTGLYPGKKRPPWSTCNVGLSGLEETSKTYEVLSH